MLEFAYNNIKNTSKKYKSLEFNYIYHQYISYEEDINSHFKFKVANKFIKKLIILIAVYRKNL